MGVGQLRPSAVPMRSHAVPCALWAASDCGYKPKARWSLAQHSQDEESVQKPINRKEVPLIISALMALAVILPARRAWQELVMLLLLLGSSNAVVISTVLRIADGCMWARVWNQHHAAKQPCSRISAGVLTVLGLVAAVLAQIGPESRAQFSCASPCCAMSEHRPQCYVLRLASWWVARSLSGAVAVGPDLSLPGLVWPLTVSEVFLCPRPATGLNDRAEAETAPLRLTDTSPPTSMLVLLLGSWPCMVLCRSSTTQRSVVAEDSGNSSSHCSEGS